MLYMLYLHNRNNGDSQSIITRITETEIIINFSDSVSINIAKNNTPQITSWQTYHVSMDYQSK